MYKMLYLRVRVSILLLFYDFPIEFWNFADSIVFFNTYVRHTAWVDTYPGGLLVHEGIILPVSISPHDDHRSSGYRPVKTLFGAVHFFRFYLELYKNKFKPLIRTSNKFYFSFRVLN